ncbi:MAG: helix-turn-helix transcriptional regulator [Myxococcota bacterium]
MADYETGRRLPTLRTLIALADALKSDGEDGTCAPHARASTASGSCFARGGKAGGLA